MAFDPDEYLADEGGTAVAEFDPNEYLGVIQPGNIDLDKRPVLKNADGSISTEKSKSFEIDGKEVLIPTIVDGKKVTDQEAIAHFKATGEHLGIFTDPKAATTYAKALHERQDKTYHGFDPDEYLGIVPTDARQGPPAPIDYLAGGGDQETMAHADEPPRETGQELVARGERLGGSERELSPAEYNAAQGIPQPPGPIPWYLTQEAADKGTGQSALETALGGLTDVSASTMAQEARARQEAQFIAEKRFADQEQRDRRYLENQPGARFADAARRGVESLLGPTERLTEPAFPLQRPLAQQPRWQDQPTLAGKIGAFEREMAAGIINFPVDAWNFATSPVGGAALATGPIEAGIGAMGFTTETVAPLVHRAIAAGFTADMIRAGLQAGTLQDQVSAALGAGLGFYGAAHPKAAKGVEPRVERAPTDLQWNGYEWVQPAKPSAAARRSAAELRAKGETIQPDTIQEMLDADKRLHGESGLEERPWVQAEPPPVPDRFKSGRYSPTGVELSPLVEQKMADAEASVPATGSPSTATTKAAETVLPTDTQSLPADAGGVRPIPMAETAVRPGLMQYKRMDDSGTGTNEADRIKGEYDPLKAGILLLWEPTNPSEYGLTGNQKYIVANGHHRWQFFSEKGVEHVNAQILRESDGYSAGDARSKAAELNIADGKGTVYDAANFIRDEAATHGEDAALARAKQIGAKGAQAATIGLKSGDDLYSAFINERISPDQAAAIAEGAPHNNALQRVGIEAAREGMKHADLWNYMQAVKAKMESGGVGREPSEVEVDMFGESDANLNDAKAMAKRATLIQTELGERVNAVAGALRRPETAKKMGVDISDPAAVQEQLVKLRMIREQARTWRSYPNIRDLVFREDLTPKEVVEELMKPEAAKQDHPLPDPSTGTPERAAIINREIDKLNGMAQTPERDARLKLLNDWIDAFGRPKKAEPGQEPPGPYHLQRHPARTPQQEETWAVVQGESGLDAPANPYGEYGLTREAAEARLQELNDRVKPEEPPIDTGNVGHRPIFEIMDELNGLEEKLRDIRLGREPSIMRGAYEKRIADLQEELAAAERAEEPGRRAAEEVAEKYERERAERERLARESSDPVRVRALQDALAIHKEKLFHEELGIGRKQKSKTAIAKAQRDVNRVQNELDMLTGKGLKPGDRVKLVSTGKEYNVTSEIYKSTETRGGGVFKGDLVVNLHDGEMGHATLFKPLNEVTRIEPGEAGTTEAATVEMRMATPKEKGIAYAITDAMRKGLSFEEALVRLGSVGDDVRVDLVRSIAEEPLRQQADLFGNDMPFNLEGETTLPSADTGDMGQGPTSSEHPGQTQFAFTEESAAPPSGPGQTPPVDIANDPEFTAMSMLGLPEVVRFAEGLLHIGIKVMRELRALQGRAAGVFSYTTGHAGKGEIHIKAEIADLLTEQDKAALQAEALQWATENAAHEREIPILTKRRYEYLLNQAYDEAKKHPSVRALRVLWHEIGHASDWFGANWYKLMGSVDKTLERGNIFGHIAGLQDYLKDVIALDPFRAPGRKLTGHERADMRRRAKEEMQRQVGPMQEIVRTIITDEPEYTNTGLTAESIVSLINSNTARTDMPELYRWFAQLPGHVKRDILRDAMRGILNHLTSNAPAGARVPTGRRIRRTQEVRETVGREPTVEEINAMFKEMFEAEMKNRNLADLEIVKQELRNSIAWWRQTETIEPYFDTPKEMYAEAFSIFMNNPQALARRAPTYTRLLWNYMNARPEVAKLYEKIQSEIKSGGLGAVREQTIIDSWHENNRKSVEAARARALSTATTFEDILNNVIYDIDRRMGVIYRAARGSPSEGALRAAIGNYLYRQTAHEEYLRRIEMTITPDLIRNNMDGDDLALLGMYQRDLHERFKIFNPYGIDPLAAKEGLDHLKARLGPQRFAVLERLRAQEHAIYDELVLQPMKAEGMLNDLAQDYVDHNIHYMTYDVIQKSGDGIAQFMNNFYGEVGAHFYRQVGTLKEISQPRTATTLKALSLISATSRNKVKRLTVQMLHESQAFPNEKIMEADSSWNETHKRMDYHIVKSPNIGTIAYLDKGVVKAFYVRRVFADAVNHGNEMDHWMHNAAVQATGWVKSGYTQLAYGFWPFAFIKDMSAFFIQMHGQRKFNEVWQRGATTNMPAPLYWLSTVEENIRAARATFRAQPNPWADAALRRRFVISRADPRGIWSAAETMHEVKLASYGHTPMAWTKEGRNVNRIVQLWNSYREVGQILERSNKIAGMRYLDERYPAMPEWKKAEIIRERAGSPDFLQRGGSAADIDFVWMFYNPWKEGARSLTRAARDDTFAFASKTTMLVVAPSVIQAVAASGGMGDEMRRKYRSIPDYDLTNYFVVPLAWADDDQRKVLYFRFPLWEGARLMHSLLWHFTTGRSQGIGSIGGGQLPSLNSLLQVAMNYLVYETTGQNPMNLRTGQPVLDEDVRKAGGWEAQKALLKDAWNQLPGSSLLYRFQDLKTDQPPRTKIEQFLAMPVVQQSLGKFVKISDRGIFDIDRHILAPDEQYKATVRLGVKEVTRKLLNKEPLSDEEKLFMRIPYAIQYLSDTFGPNATNFTDPERKRLEGKSPEQQMMILEKNPSIQR